MKGHIIIGRKGEALAAKIMRSKGHLIRHKNLRLGRFEIDLVTEHMNILHFVEVKTMATKKFGYPEAHFDPTKQQNVRRAIEKYIESYKATMTFQFDFLAIVLFPAPEYFLFEDFEFWSHRMCSY